VTIGFFTFPIVNEYVLNSRLAWSTTVDGDKTGSTAYHGWVITPTDHGCHVLSEETQQGPFFLEDLGQSRWALSLSPGMGRGIKAGSRNASCSVEGLTPSHGRN
jgi:hypothetical protein